MPKARAVTDPKGIAAVDYCNRLIADQEKVLLSGEFNRIEEYKAACAVIRNLKRNRDEFIRIFGEDSDDE